MGTDPESISSPKSFPQWMRSKIENRLDGEGTVPFSPPAHDDSFFYIRYPTGSTATSGAEKMSISEQIRASTSTQKELTGTALPMGHISAAVSEWTAEQQRIGGRGGAAAKVDLSKHTEPCRQYLAGANNKSTLLPGQKKSLGIDDGFKGAGAACGSSVIRVAHQMVNLNRPFTRGFTVAHFDEAVSEIDVPDCANPQTRSNSVESKAGVAEEKAGGGHYMPEMNMMRRGSKSLPASPMGSPKAVRKNPYFTGIFTSAQNSTEPNRGWLLSSLLGVQRETTQSTTSSTTNIAEETERDTMEYESSGVAFGPQQQQGRPSANPINSVFRATKPSEIREMNFWSPTSM